MRRNVGYVKYVVNCRSVFLYHNIQIKAKVIYFERGLFARVGFVVWSGFVCTPFLGTRKPM